MSTLMVCTANVCRSPAAEILWRAETIRRGVIAPVSSAGVQAMPGSPMHDWFIDRVSAESLDGEAHRSRRLTRAMALKHELILVMERRHQRYLLDLAPELAGRVHLLGRWTVGEIADPIDRAAAVFEHAYAELNAAVTTWLDRLCRQPGDTLRSAVPPHLVPAR